MKLFTDAVVAIDGSKPKAENNRDRNLTQQKINSRLEHLEKSAKQYLDDLITPNGLQPLVLPKVMP
jgi:hypothetical protein